MRPITDLPLRIIIAVFILVTPTQVFAATGQDHSIQTPVRQSILAKIDVSSIDDGASDPTGITGEQSFANEHEPTGATQPEISPEDQAQQKREDRMQRFINSYPVQEISSKL